MASPGLNEMTTTTLRTKPMKFVKGGESPNAKASAKAVATTGTHAPEKDDSSKSKLRAAVGPAISVAPAPAPSVSEPKKFDGSSEDYSKDYKEAKRKGISTEQWEDSAGDRISDNAGERKLKAEEAGASPEAPGYKKGTSAFSNAPKASHGYGHPASARDGHLRNSGHTGAHRLGSKKK